MDFRSSSLVGRRDIELKTLPFGIGEIGRVAPFHAQERRSLSYLIRFSKQFLHDVFPETGLPVLLILGTSGERHSKRAGVVLPALLLKNLIHTVRCFSALPPEASGSPSGPAQPWHL